MAEDTSKMNRKATDPELTDQERNWELFSVLGMTWEACTNLSEEDKTFLLEKVENVKQQMRAQAFMQGQG
jgi:hypothetical protein